jgi:four helix bundle protein
MPKEIRKPKPDWRRVLDEVEREGSAFWTWGDKIDGNGTFLREDPLGKNPPPNLMERVALFGERIVRLAKKIPRGVNHPENNRLIDQLVGAGTSIGANYCEADDAVSGKDFKFKIGISRKESKETMFFLRMVAASEESLADEARVLWREAKELNLIFGSIWRK